ncbi:hypothetical protein CDAR_197861 [Caerostris darwini]|uniref:Uncharacterized protein n=1 Tax=Caerostris darwini TaxID=1538125 RepID=A0AAV4SEH6_9ARAC|nr:hypothetical protein CDAR_197861 [Caerostris darwini]
MLQKNTQGNFFCNGCIRLLQMCVETPFPVTVRKTRKEVGEENRKKTLLNFLSPRRSATVQWLTFSAFNPETKGLQQSMPSSEQCEET